MTPKEIESLAREAFDHPLWEKFEAYDNANPHVLDKLAEATRAMRARGVEKTAINRLVQDLRWDALGEIEGQEGEGVKLPNAFAPLYARMIAVEHPDLADMFKFNPLGRT